MLLRGGKIITIKCVQDGLIDSSCAQFINHLPSNIKRWQRLLVGDVLVSLTGNVGRVGIVFEENLLLNQRVAKIIPKNMKLLPFLYFLFRTHEFKNKLEVLAKGTAQSNLSPLKIKYDENIALKSSECLTPIFNKIICNNQMNKTLEQIRDILIRKLMNGKINLENISI